MRSIMKMLMAATVIALLTESVIIANISGDPGKKYPILMIPAGVCEVCDVSQEQLTSIAEKVEAPRLEQYRVKYMAIADLCEKMCKIKKDNKSMSQNQKLNSASVDNNDQQDKSTEEWYKLGLATAKIIKTNDPSSSSYSGMTPREILNAENAHATGNTELYYLGIADGLHQK